MSCSCFQGLELPPENYFGWPVLGPGEPNWLTNQQSKVYFAAVACKNLCSFYAYREKPILFCFPSPFFFFFFAFSLIFFHFCCLGWKGKWREENWPDSVEVLGYHCSEKWHGETPGWCSGSTLVVLPIACWGISPLGSNSFLLPEQLTEDSQLGSLTPYASHR